MTRKQTKKLQKMVWVRLPVAGYDSVNVPSGLYRKVKALVKRRSDLGYRSVTEFVAEAVRTRLVDIGETTPERR